MPYYLILSVCEKKMIKLKRLMFLGTYRIGISASLGKEQYLYIFKLAYKLFGKVVPKWKITPKTICPTRFFPY